MRLFAPSLVCLVLALAFTKTAMADSYSWSGRSQRFSAEQTKAGFNDGAGEGGWSEESARTFASWAQRFNQVIPRGVRVSWSRDVNDDGVLEIARAGSSFTIQLADADLEDVLPIVALLFGKLPPPAPKTPPALFTIQLLASATSRSAESFARDLDRQRISPGGSFFTEACHPCSIPEAHVLTPTTDSLYRVITGIYDDRQSADRALSRFQRAFHRPGWVRSL